MSVLFDPDPSNTAQPLSGFEGAEKKLEIDFLPVVDLRRMSRTAIDSILTLAKCTILNKTGNQHFDSYILSESSLFIYPYKVIIKTCGTTSLLNCLPRLLACTKAMGTKPEFVQYSRTQFRYPDKQPEIHRKFELEVDYLNSFFKVGSGHIFGPINGPRWHLYTADLNPNTSVPSKEQTLEIVMTELDPQKMHQFFQAADASDTTRPHSSEEATTLSGIDLLIPGAQIDAHLFEPCGYSCNALIDDAYFTIHITPENHCSFVSFETNVQVTEYEALVSRVLNTFRPGRFTISLFVDEQSKVRYSQRAMPVDYPGFVTKTCAFQSFDGPYNVSCSHLALAPASTPREEARVAVSPIAELKAVLEEDSSSSSDEKEPDAVVLPYSLTHTLVPAQLLAVATRAVELGQFQVVKAAQDDKSPAALIRSIVSQENPQDPFFLVNLADLVQKFYRWSVAYPHIQPFFTVSNNGHEGVLRALNSLGSGFTCTTVQEIKSLLALGVAPKRILFANPWKSESHLRFCEQNGVHQMVFTDLPELRKIAKVDPQARLFLHVAPNYAARHVPASAIVDHHMVPGAPLDRVPALFEEAAALKLRVIGCSFDIGDVCYDPNQFKYALKDAKEVFRHAKNILGYELRKLDIGSGFPDETDTPSGDTEERPSFAAIASRLNHLVPKYFSSKVRVIARPSRFLTTSSHVFAVNVVARKPLEMSNTPVVSLGASEGVEVKRVSGGFAYYINDGNLGAFNSMLFERRKVHAKPVNESSDAEAPQFPSSVFGPNDGKQDASAECVGEPSFLPEVKVGEWLYFSNMGAHPAPLTAANFEKTPAFRFVVPTPAF